MTALVPFESHSVRAGPSGKYPLNKVCAHPECNEPVGSKHHIYPKGNLNSKAWFLFLDGDPGENPIPHVTGLCGSGTTKHHGDAEGHRAWIKYEDGEFVWYDRLIHFPPPDTAPEDYEEMRSEEWVRVGPLNPQPGSVEGKPKRGRRKTGAERSNRTNVTVKIPKGFANGPAVWDELFGDGKDVDYGDVRKALDELGAKGDNPVFEVICDMAHDWLSRLGKR